MRAKLNERKIQNGSRIPEFSTGPHRLFQWKHTFEFKVFYLDLVLDWNL